MRFFLFGQAEGVRWDGPELLWACVRDGRVTDASVPAREAGVKPGMSDREAAALLPGLSLYAESDEPSLLMQRLWHSVWSFTPWLETVGIDAFLAQWTGDRLPIPELRALVQGLADEWGATRRMTLGLGESPELARALVEWRRLEPVPCAKVIRLQSGWPLLLSPGLIRSLKVPATPEDTCADAVRTESHRESVKPAGAGGWIDEMPLDALWMLPQSARDALRGLGLLRVREVRGLPVEVWRRIGVEKPPAILQPEGGSSRVRVNYPPPELASEWRAAAADALPCVHVPELLGHLTAQLSHQLMRHGWSAQTVGVAWEGPDGCGRYERPAKQPLSQRDALAAHLAPAVREMRGDRMERIRVYARGLRPCVGVQLSLGLDGPGGLGMSRVAARCEVPRPAAAEAGRLEELVAQVNRRFPGGLRRGARPGFRELRLQALESLAL